ncbi:MAG TPA: ornithine carbamoyltransferase [archaeon]|nr:ornithine carbamoyltransferase [archaeon]
MKRDFLSINDFSPVELKKTIRLAAWLKRVRKTPLSLHLSEGSSMAMIFEKPSLRTRVTFELAMVELGGHAFELQAAGVRLGERESVPDVAHNLERWVDILVVRVFENETIRVLADNMKIPVINALCNREHPCQAVADLLTVAELSKDAFPRVKLAYVGDGNNVCHSLILISSALGIKISVATPEGYEPQPEYVGRAAELCVSSGGSLELGHDPEAAVEGADFIYTDVWASMGQEDEMAQRREVFNAFQVNEKLVRRAAKNYYLLHCLPAHRGEEITDEIIDGPHSKVFDQAENRLHAQKAIILKLLTPEIAENLIEKI